MSADRLVIAARYYTMTAWRVTRALAPDRRRNAATRVVIAAVETDCAHWPARSPARRIARSQERPTKTSIVSISEGDANGSAKVSRLVVGRIAPRVAGADGDRPRGRRRRADGPGPRPGRNRRGPSSAVSARDVFRQAGIRYGSPHDVRRVRQVRRTSYRWPTSFPRKRTGCRSSDDCFPKEADRDAGSSDLSYFAVVPVVPVVRQRSTTPGGAKMICRRG